jgi:hypothetical protein
MIRYLNRITVAMPGGDRLDVLGEIGTVLMVDWSKLAPWNEDRYRSFQALCYQTARVLYGDSGKLTPIDDSGGGDGVEFYLTLGTGEQWGWQAKFYHPNPRLAVSNRKSAIQDSLKRACEKHARLSKWILCTPTDFTPNEQDWFEKVLPESIPEGKAVKLVHWGDSDFGEWLTEPRFEGKKHYFFGELELTMDWFRKQLEKRWSVLQDKFNPLLHVETGVDARIHALLGDGDFAEFLARRITQLDGLLEEYSQAVTDLGGPGPRGVKWDATASGLLGPARRLQDHLELAATQLHGACQLLHDSRLEEVRGLNWEPALSGMEESFDAYREAESRFDAFDLAYDGDARHKEEASREARDLVDRPAWVAADVRGIVHDLVSELGSIKQAELHVLGDAGVGKTHIVAHISHSRLEGGLPALLVLGREFIGHRPLWRQLLDILDVPPSYSWSDLLQALSAAAEAHETRIPLVIDGLNEATVNGVFSRVWELGLPGLVREIAEMKSVVLVTTCRGTYREAIWDGNWPENVVNAHGFGHSVEEAVDKYFTHYKIKADITGVPLRQFEHPIYLKIFCETKNRARLEEKHIYVGEQTLFEVFDEYLDQANSAVCRRLGLKCSARVVNAALTSIAEHLWERRSRSVPLAQLAEVVDCQPLESLSWESSKTRALLDEGVLLCRDWVGDGEVVYFTYDMLAGYVIAKYLVGVAASDIEGFVRSEGTIRQLFQEDRQGLHPLWNDVGRCLAALLPVRTGHYLHDLSANPVARGFSLQALFEIAPQHIDDSAVTLVAELFERGEHRTLLLELAAAPMAHVGHPLNVSFWSERLRILSMQQRDLSWTEHVRGSIDDFETLLIRFEGSCRSGDTWSDVTKQRMRLLAEYAMWILTSTVRPLRDQATRTLYWYGRRQPEELIDLVVGSLDINDPYVAERMLAAAYGVAMARQFDFKDLDYTQTILPHYSQQLYQAMFGPGAPHATTHILARDYARRTIDIALAHHPGLLTASERARIVPPFSDGGIRDWGESEDRNENEYSGGNAPIQMDFGNYTIGGLVEGRDNYDFDHEEYKTVRANIYWRLYQLGYSFEAFGDIDRQLAQASWRYGRTNDGGKIDRYGKKYSWIAFFELAGLREDHGSLPPWYGDGRTSDCDIDPSFPVEVKQYDLVHEDLLGDREVPTDDWVSDSACPAFGPYVAAGELCGEQGPWVLLDGYVSQESPQIDRRIFIFARALIVAAAEAPAIVQCLEQQSFHGRDLPDIPADFYTYAGEVPWCETFPGNGLDSLDVVLATKQEEELCEELVVLRGGEPLPEDEQGDFWQLVSDVRDMSARRSAKSPASDDWVGLLEAELAEHGLEVGLRVIPVRRQVAERQRFDVLIPVRSNSWEYYHSVIVPARHVCVPTRELAEHLDLCSQPQTFDLYEKSGRRASMTLRHGEPWHAEQRFTYMRQDLLQRFLCETHAELIWVIWGERLRLGGRSPWRAFKSITSFRQRLTE